MAIHPGYAEAILDGRKRVEFRKRPLSPDINTVVIYATAPVKGIVGEFTVDGSVVAAPDDLWSIVGAVGEIAESAFAEYYAKAATGVGILVKDVRRYNVPVALSALSPAPAVPQSFTYLPSEVLGQLHRLDAGEDRSLFSSAVRVVFDLARAALPRVPVAVPFFSAAVRPGHSDVAGSGAIPAPSAFNALVRASISPAADS